MFIFELCLYILTLTARGRHAMLLWHYHAALQQCGTALHRELFCNYQAVTHGHSASFDEQHCRGLLHLFQWCYHSVIILTAVHGRLQPDDHDDPPGGILRLLLMLNSPQPAGV